MEGLGMVPRNEWPSPEELEDYTESRYEPDPDYSDVMSQLSIWLADHRRDEELKRSEQQREPLLGHGNDIESQRHGFNPEDFDLREVVSAVKKAPLH
jgi:hypothetical protein